MGVSRDDDASAEAGPVDALEQRRPQVRPDLVLLRVGRVEAAVHVRPVSLQLVLQRQRRVLNTEIRKSTN